MLFYVQKKYILNKNILILFGDVPLITSKSIKKLIINFDKKQINRFNDSF